MQVDPRSTHSVRPRLTASCVHRAIHRRTHVMKKERKPINDEHVAAVGDRLDHALAKGPAPPRARTRQALVNLYKARIVAMREAHFSMAEIADALSVNGIVFTAAALSTYLARSSAADAHRGTATKKAKSSTFTETLKLKPKPPRRQVLEGATNVQANNEHNDCDTAASSTLTSNLTSGSTGETLMVRRAEDQRVDSSVGVKNRAVRSWYEKVS